VLPARGDEDVVVALDRPIEELRPAVVEQLAPRDEHRRDDGTRDRDGEDVLEPGRAIPSTASPTSRSDSPVT
jgi:hypothetical protein